MEPLRSVRRYQYNHPIHGHDETMEEKALVDLGVRIFDYLPDYGFVVRNPRSKLKANPQPFRMSRMSVPSNPPFPLEQRELDKKKESHVTVNIVLFEGESVERGEAEMGLSGWRNIEAFILRSPGAHSKIGSRQGHRVGRCAVGRRGKTHRIAQQPDVLGKFSLGLKITNPFGIKGSKGKVKSLASPTADRLGP